MSEQTTIPAVRKEITVRATPERAFDVFTSGMSTWWPMDTHAVGPTPATSVLEPRAGGRLYNLADDGTESDWGRVLVWEPPSRLVIAWLLNPQWTYEPDVEKASEVEIRFEDERDGTTRVELVHSGFERYAEGGEAMRDQVDAAGGWGTLLELYARAV
jgi:uncharacterized protein YndB with AHSA1/START domain